MIPWRLKGIFFGDTFVHDEHPSVKEVWEAEQEMKVHFGMVGPGFSCNLDSRLIKLLYALKMRRIRRNFLLVTSCS